MCYRPRRLTGRFIVHDMVGRKSTFGGKHAENPDTGSSGGLDILFVIGQLDVGGTENHLATVASALVCKGWRIAVYSLQGDGPVAATLRKGGVEIIYPPLQRPEHKQSLFLRVFRLARASLCLLNVFRKRRPKIVHFFLPAVYIIGAPLAAMTAVPIRVMSRRCLNVYQRSYPFVGWLERRLHPGMTAILGNSLGIVRELYEQEHISPERLGLIYNGLDLERFAATEPRQEVRAQLGLLPDELILTAVANLIPYKGHADILDALARAKPKLPARWKLLIVGRDDGIGEALKMQANDLGISSHVAFLGVRNDIPQIYAASDIGLLCSHQEGFSNALLEGMASGLPMVATNVGGNTEAVKDGISGIIVPPKDPMCLADALVRLANDAHLRMLVGKAARERVARHFSLGACIEAYDKLYRTLLSGGQVVDVEQIQVRL